MVRYGILGAVELCDGERRIGVGGPRQVALLALLLVNANRAVSVDRLIDSLWSDLGRTGAHKRLRVAIARLRRALDPDGVRAESVLRTVAGGYLLAVEPGELDADVFQRRVEDGCRALEAGDPARARGMLSDALRMWRGPALAEVAYEEFAQPEIRRLEELRLATLEARADCALRLGEHGELVGELKALVAAHPGRERLTAQLMLALYRCGRQGEALEAYAGTRAYLADQLGLQPGPALQALQADVLTQSPALQPVFDEPGSVAGAAADEAGVEAGPQVLALPRALHNPADLPFVGRDAELASLRERWTHVCGGTRSAVVIGGDAGIGKTRLASELAGVVHRESGLVLYGRCDEGLAVPYQPFVEALRPYALAVGPDHLRRELGDLAPELVRLLPELTGLGEPVRGDPESERFALFEAVAALMELMTREQNALLVLDDLHWAAGPTLQLLRHLIRSERPLGALLLGIYRETELDPSQPLAQLLADLRRDASAERLSIGGLDEPAITALVKATLGSALREPAELVRVLCAQTAGNPFFLRELLADVSGSGERLRSGITAAQLEVPEGLRQVIGHRVARLSAPAGRALRVAAVAGARSSLLLLERVLGDESDVLDALDEAVAAGLLREAGHGEYVFAHALVRQTIYAQLGTARQMRLHRRLGEALETLGDTETCVEALAYHFAQAAPDGHGVKAADYALAAGRSATRRLGYEEAAAHYERGLEALDLAGRPDEHRRCELLLALGEARWGAGELDEARQTYAHAAELADKLGNATALARAALGICGPHRFEAGTVLAQPIAGLLERALAALGEDDSALRALLMGRLAAHTAAAQHKRALADQALQMARRVAERATLADVLASAHRATLGPDTLDESLAMAEELARVADEAGNHRLRALAHARLVRHQLELGDIDAVQRELDALQRLTRTRRERYLTWFLAVLRANHAHLAGRLEECERLAREALALRFEGYDELAVQTFGAQMFFVRREQGRLDEIMPAVADLAAQYPEIVAWRAALAYSHAHLEHAAHARHELEAISLDGFRGVPRDSLWLSTLAMLCEVVVQLGDVARARVLYKLLLPYADRCVVLVALLSHGSASRQLGQLATVLSRYEDAADHFERALTVNAQIRSPLVIAHTQHDYARVLLRRDHPGDRDKALTLLTHALNIADQRGMKALADRARALELTAGATGPPQALRVA